MAHRSERGFTLIEVVVAFVLLALVLATAFQIFSEGMSRAGQLDERSQALELARSRLAVARFEEPLKEGQASGESDDHRMRWTTTIARSDEGVDPAKPMPSAYALYRVEVRVDWRAAGDRERSITLATLGLGPRS